jgi:hypothetical protein
MKLNSKTKKHQPVFIRLSRITPGKPVEMPGKPTNAKQQPFRIEWDFLRGYN